LSRPAFAAIQGAAEPSTVTLGMAAQELFDAAADRLDAGLSRRDRLISKIGGGRWLWLVPQEADVARWHCDHGRTSPLTGTSP
jgi:hypothetical protein